MEHPWAHWSLFRKNQTREEKKRKKRRSPQKTSREVIFDRITRVLGGFEVSAETSSEEEEDNDETEMEEVTPGAEHDANE